MPDIPLNGAANGASAEEKERQTRSGEDLCDKINAEEDLFIILGFDLKGRERKKIGVEMIRSSFLARCRICHPE